MNTKTLIRDPMGLPALRGWFEDIPTGEMIPYSKRSHAKAGDIIHFFIQDKLFRSFLDDPGKHLDKLRKGSCIIGPDPTILAYWPLEQQIHSIFQSREVSAFCEQHGVPVIPNVRWGDRRSYPCVFSGIPVGSVVAIGTLGLMRRRKGTSGLPRELFKEGLRETIERIRPRCVLIYGRMPNDVFDEFRQRTSFIRYPSRAELVFKKGDN